MVIYKPEITIDDLVLILGELSYAIKSTQNSILDCKNQDFKSGVAYYSEKLEKLESAFKKLNETKCEIKETV